MTCDEFANLVDKIAEENGFNFEYILIMGNKEGKLHSFIHVWNERIKPCKPIRYLSRIFGMTCKTFEKCYH